MSPTIFNVVVDAIIRYWVMVVEPTEDGILGLGLLIQELAVYLYADDGLVVSTNPKRLHRAFDVLYCLLNRVGLRKNARNMVSMACQLFHMPVQISAEAYMRHTTVTGKNFQERQRRRVACP